MACHRPSMATLAIRGLGNRRRQTPRSRRTSRNTGAPTPPTRAETLKPYAPELTAYELACHEAARRGRVLGLTHRVLTTIKAAPDQCTSAFALNGYRMACCASSLRQTCWQTARATRKSIGWPLDCGSADANETRLPSDLNSTDANATHRQRRPHVAPRVLPSSSPTPTAQWVASWRES